MLPPASNLQIIRHIYHTIGKAGLFSREANKMVLYRCFDIRRTEAHIVAAEIIIQFYHNAVVATAMTAGDAFLGLCHTVATALVIIKGIHRNFGIGCIGIQFTLGAENTDIAAAFVKAVHRKACSCAAFEFQIHHLMVYHVIIADECQFFKAEQIDQLRAIVDQLSIPVLCFGLRTDFLTHLFEGSRRLFEVADSITEIKTICTCGKKAIVNARIDQNGKVVTTGGQILIGGNDSYVAMCHHCWTQKIEADEESEN